MFCSGNVAEEGPHRDGGCVTSQLLECTSLSEAVKVTLNVVSFQLGETIHKYPVSLVAPPSYLP